jgi:hypothetical protein
VSTSQPGDGVPKDLTEVLQDALDADPAGQLRLHVADLAAAAFRMSCGLGEEAGIPFERFALALRQAVRHGPRPVLAEATPPAGAEPSPWTEPVVSGQLLPGWLSQLRETVAARSESRLRVTTDEPGELWRQLHLGTLWLAKGMHTQVVEALGGASPDYLVPARADVGEAGITWDATRTSPDIAAILSRWPGEFRETGDRLTPVIGLIFTYVDQAAWLYTADDRPASVITPLAGADDQLAYRQRVLGILERIAQPATPPSALVDWLGALDEALRSVFPLPVPARTSTWASMLDISRECLLSHARRVSPGAHVELVDAVTPYKDERRKQLAPDGGNIAVQPFTAVERYEVLWSLRAYVELPGDATASRIIRPARVLYGHEDGFAYPRP